MAILKGTLAIFGGLIASVLLTLSIDALLSWQGVLDMENFHNNSMPLIVVVLLYRFAFNIFGCYVAAFLAQKRPQLHALLLAAVGLLFSLLGAARMWQFAPDYYNIALIMLSLPAGLIAAYLYRRKFVYQTHRKLDRRKPDHRLNNHVVPALRSTSMH